MDIQEITAVDSSRRKQAEARLQDRVRVGAERQQAVIKGALETVIVDKIWYPAKMYFRAIDGQLLTTYHGSDNKSYTVHKHALGQMASICDIPRTYVSKLRDSDKPWKHELLAHTLNTHFHQELFETARGKPIGFLRRAVGDQIRGFQSRNFGRVLATAPLLKTFVEQCGNFKAGPVDAKSSDVVVTLKCCMPYVFEPVTGEFVAFGVSFKNSDFGAAKLSVGGNIMRISSGTMAVTEGAMNKVHLGKAIESDDELIISDETLGKELDAVRSAVADMVRHTLSPENIKAVLTNIALAHERGIEWFRLSGTLSKVLTKGELELTKSLLEKGDDLVDLPPLHRGKDGELQATAWWASNLVGWFANKEEDAERRQNLQELAGNLLEK